MIASPGVAAAPDISSLTPRERAARLYDRIMRLHEEQQRDSVLFFAPMALASYAEIDDLDVDGRYDLARIAMVAGQVGIAAAQADSILARDKTHLLGLLLSSDLARFGGDSLRARGFDSTFARVHDPELLRGLPEYSAHRQEIDMAFARIRRPLRGP
jgi:hypothetical protein